MTVTQYVPERVTPRCMSASQAIGEQTRTAQRQKNRNASLNVQDKLHRKKTRRLHLQEVQAGGARIALRPGRTDIKQRRSHPHCNAVRGHLQVVLRSTFLLHERANKASNAHLGLGGEILRTSLEKQSYTRYLQRSRTSAAQSTTCPDRSSPLRTRWQKKPPLWYSKT